MSLTLNNLPVLSRSSRKTLGLGVARSTAISKSPPPFDTVTLSDSRPASGKRRVANFLKGTLAVGAGVGLAILSAPVAVGAGVGAIAGGVIGYAGESLKDTFSLGFSGVSTASKLKTAKKGAAVGAAIGGAIASGSGIVVAGLAVGGAAAVGMAKVGQGIADRINPLNWF